MTFEFNIPFGEINNRAANDIGSSALSAVAPFMPARTEVWVDYDINRHVYRVGVELIFKPHYRVAEVFPVPVEEIEGRFAGTVDRLVERVWESFYYRSFYEVPNNIILGSD